MATIKISDLNVEASEAQTVTGEEAAQIMGGATAKPKAKPKQEYLTYELENVLVSSYS